GVQALRHQRLDRRGRVQRHPQLPVAGPHRPPPSDVATEVRPLRGRGLRVDHRRRTFPEVAPVRVTSIETAVLSPGVEPEVMQERPLRTGDTVQVKSAGEILATLDEHGTLESLPFMPEMVAYCGKRLVVEHRADNVCIFSVARRVPRTVILGDL